MTKKKVLPGLGVDTPTAACGHTWQSDHECHCGRKTADGNRAPLSKNEDGTPSPKWTRTGDTRAIPPMVTVTPSVWPNAPHGWHGFLTDGALVPAWTS